MAARGRVEKGGDLLCVFLMQKGDVFMVSAYIAGMKEISEGLCV